MKKHIQQLPNGIFFVNLLTEKFGYSAKVLRASWKYKPSFYFFSLHKIKMSKQQIIYPLNYLFHIGSMLTISKVFTFLSILSVWK